LTPCGIYGKLNLLGKQAAILFIYNVSFRLDSSTEGCLLEPIKKDSLYANESKKF